MTEQQTGAANTNSLIVTIKRRQCRLSTYNADSGHTPVKDKILSVRESRKNGTHPQKQADLKRSTTVRKIVPRLDGCPDFVSAVESMQGALESKILKFIFKISKNIDHDRT